MSSPLSSEAKGKQPVGAPPSSPAIIPPAPPVSELIKVFRPPVATPVDPSADLPDSYFEPTTAEIHAAYSSQTRRLEGLVNAPLKTQALKEKEEKAKADRWPNTTIRIKFPDQTMLERTFLSSERIKSVYVFLRSALIEEAQADKFILYQAPRRELKVSDPAVKVLSLSQLQLSPSSVLLVKFQTEAYNSSTLPPPLLPQILQLARPLPSAKSAPEAKPSGKSGASPATKASTAGAVEKKMPKWFKKGMK